MITFSELFYDDLKQNDEYFTHGRTITETVVTNYAGVSGDFGDIHLDKEVGRATIFERNIAHGLCVLSVASGLVVQTGLLNKTIAFYGIHNWSFTKPVFFDDTIKVKILVLDKKDSSKKDRGIVTFNVNILNQRDEVVQKGEWSVMIARKKSELK